LLADDDEAFRTVMAGELRRLSLEVVAAACGADEKARAVALQPQVVLLDLRLPDMNGLEVLKFIAEAVPGCAVIMLTGHGSIDTAIESIRLGAFDYVAKPCPLDELELKIGRALERQSLQKRASLLERGLTLPDASPALVADSPQIRQVVSLAERVAPTDSTVTSACWPRPTATCRPWCARACFARTCTSG
jgi:DNA-binding NtrC family response regulator